MSETYNAHPMLEPLDYDLDPEQASQQFSGNTLNIYNLLWNAAVATHVEGPVIRKHQLFSSLSDKATLSLKWKELIEPGWSNFLTPNLFGELQYFNNTFYPSNIMPTFISSYDSNRLLSKEYLNNLSCSYSPERSLNISVKKVPVENLCYSLIIEQMAKYKVARPSTYANRLESTIKNKLIGEDNGTLFLTTYAKNVLDKIAELPTNEQLNKQTSYAIEKAINTIEYDNKKAGEYLNYFCEKIFKKTSALSVWLDSLDIEGETLDVIHNNKKNKKHQNNEHIRNAEGKNQEGMTSNLEPSLIDILHKKNNLSKIECTEHAWDDFSFQTQLLNTKFTGRFYTRKANRLDTSKERIFQEHLDNFETTIYYGFWMNIPYKNLAKFIDFTILTDRTKGFLYLEKLKITYSYEFFVYDSYEVDESEIKNKVVDIFSEIKIDDSVRLFTLFEDEVEIIILKDDGDELLNEVV